MQIHRCLLSIPLPEVCSRLWSATWRLSSSHILPDVQAAQIMLRVGDLRSYCRFMAQVGIRPSQNRGPGSEENMPKVSLPKISYMEDMVKFRMFFFVVFFSKTYRYWFFGRFPYFCLMHKKSFLEHRFGDMRVSRCCKWKAEPLKTR